MNSIYRNLTLEMEKANRTKTIALQSPGIPASVTQATLNEAGLTSNSAIEDFYAWSNGVTDTVAPIDEISIFPGFYQLSLSESLHIAAASPGASESRPDLPLFADGGGDYYACSTSALSPWPVIHRMDDNDARPEAAPSIESFIETLIYCYRNSIFFHNETGKFDMDDATFSQLTNDWLG